MKVFRQAACTVMGELLQLYFQSVFKVLSRFWAVGQFSPKARQKGPKGGAEKIPPWRKSPKMFKQTEQHRNTAVIRLH